MSIMLFVINIHLYSSGIFSKPTKPKIDNIESLNNDPILKKFYEDDNRVKPSLEYLEKITQAKNALLKADYFTALDLFTKLNAIFGDLPEIVFGLGETYFFLGDQPNAMIYYKKALSNDNDTIKNGFTAIEISSRYRLAYLYYQLEQVPNFINELSYIIRMSNHRDDAIIPILLKQNLDYILRLFVYKMDYSYIAHREFAVYQLFTNQEINNEALISDLVALSMIVQSVTEYLKSQYISYEFSDLAYMIELLNKTKEGRNLLNSYKIERLIVALRKYYNSNYDNQSKLMSFYCTQLLESLSFFEPADSEQIYEYTAILR